jgi:hypothetical protein
VFNSWQEQWWDFSLRHSVKWVPGAVTPEVKWPSYEANNSPPSTAEVNIACSYTRVYPKVSGLSHNEINNKKNNKHSLRSKTKGYGGKTH